MLPTAKLQECLPKWLSVVLRAQQPLALDAESFPFLVLSRLPSRLTEQRECLHIHGEPHPSWDDSKH